MKKEAVGYIRISTNKQEQEGQQAEINKFCADNGFKLLRTEREVISSRKKKRRIFEIVEELEEGQVLIVYELSRLGRSLREIFNLVETVKEQGCQVKVISHNLTLGAGLTRGEAVHEKTLIFALGIGAEMERDLISERTKIALKQRKAEGMTLGRPKGKGEKVRKALKEKGITESTLADYRKLGISFAKLGEMLGLDRRTVREYFKN